MMCELPSNAVIADAVPRPLRRVLDRLQRHDPAHPGPGPGLRRWSPAGFDERDPAVLKHAQRWPSRPARRAASTSASAARAPATTPTSPSGCSSRASNHVAQPRHRRRDLAPPGKGHVADRRGPSTGLHLGWWQFRTYTSKPLTAGSGGRCNAPSLRSVDVVSTIACSSACVLAFDPCRGVGRGGVGGGRRVVALGPDLAGQGWRDAAVAAG